MYFFSRNNKIEFAKYKNCSERKRVENLRRARGNRNSKKIENKKEYKYVSDMIELGYDPDAFVEDDVTETEAVSEQENQTFTAEQLFDGELADNEQTDNREEADTQQVKPKKKRLVFVASLVTVLVMFFIVMGFGGFFDSTTSSPEGEINEDYMVPVDKATGKVNVLILGVDKDGLRTDTIVVASYDLDTNKVNMLSIPRDTRMYVGKKYQKINAAHAISQSGKIKGPQGTIEAVTRLTCIPINYYVEFSFDSFKNTIDALGGVDFDVPRDMDYEDPVQKLYIHLDKGFQHLDGDKAEQLVRFRRYPEGDIARVQMQQQFIKAVAEQKLNIGILGKLPELYSTLKDDIKTNFGLTDITKYINNLKELSPDNITMYQLPGQFGGAEYGASYWIADMTEVKTLIETEFGFDAEKATIHSSYNSKEAKADREKKTTSPTKKTESNKTEKPTSTKKASSTKKTTEKSDDDDDDNNEKKTTKASASAKASAKATEKSSAKASASPGVKPSTNPSAAAGTEENETVETVVQQPEKTQAAVQTQKPKMTPKPHPDAVQKTSPTPGRVTPAPTSAPEKTVKPARPTPNAAG